MRGSAGNLGLLTWLRGSIVEKNSLPRPHTPFLPPDYFSSCGSFLKELSCSYTCVLSSMDTFGHFQSDIFARLSLEIQLAMGTPSSALLLSMPRPTPHFPPTSLACPPSAPAPLLSVQFSHSVVSDSLQPHGLQHTRPPCPSPAPGVYSNLCPSSR